MTARVARYTILAIILVSCLSLKNIQTGTFKKIQFSGFAQGTTWHTTYYAKDTIVTRKQIDSILSVLDSSLSIYKPYSTIVAFNNSNTGIETDKHFKKVVAKSLDTYSQTNGLFDITVLPLVEAWGFGAKAPEKEPDSAKIRSLLKCVSSKHLQLKNNRLVKTKPCVRIDVNGIAQGYSVDVIADFFKAKGITNFIAEIGGEIRAQGKKQPGNTAFKIGIEAPAENEFERAPVEKIVIIGNGAITTSGNYRKYHESNGKKISHLVDPRTGYSVENELISVTVYAKDAITADAYDNALMTMGLKSAIRFVEKRPELAAHFIYRSTSGKIADTATTRFYKLIQQ